MKATRFSWESKQNKEKYQEDRERQKNAKTSEEAKRETPKNSTDIKPKQQPQQMSNSDFDLLGTGSTTAGKTSYGNSNGASKHKDLLDDFGDSQPQKNESKPNKQDTDWMI
eukprot:CAMPEP_0176469184 /NCGR_PEP_ID=MMETSP0127-20121128/39616_1 /TAXON_ID=938130 /ORGANISM="Platyophrya macrostoma, Strain WH" /LENGTH=110 /DNA_ID=CAMNT_0017863053 /DNA_START=258 /DNA_END=590 /DNA_ORIENTATION=-